MVNQWIMNCKGIIRKRPWPNFRYNPAILLMGLRKATKILSQDSRSPDPDFNTRPPKYEHAIVKFDMSTRQNDIDSPSKPSS